MVRDYLLEFMENESRPTFLQAEYKFECTGRTQWAGVMVNDPFERSYLLIQIGDDGIEIIGRADF